ncbi:HAD family phosphatase [Nocardioides sp. GY 10127]|uniref:HAD family hydrolase n=1 Tax=Nocardioides sp. GY 10127 TaxID=2569762 RepID=UPI0010A8C82F|nr:HAD family phosphatase [Nocardioides sp. GY 10127]TIC82765.1 HAD family phosphatase [Nocardioides sp. GY 10127]
MTPAGILFDLDGTLIDTEGFYVEAGEELVRAAGLAWSDTERFAAVGTAVDDFARMVVATGVDMEVDAIVDYVVGRVNERVAGATPYREGALELLASVRASGIPMGLVTMSHGPTVDAVLADPAMPAFDVVVTGDQVERGKPEPEAYLLATERLGLAPQDCIVLEDSHIGLASARAAGVRTVAVPVYVPVEPELADVHWTGLVGRTVEDVKAAFSALSHS